ncbi:hypothetical protein BHE74_00051683 [Ensete ventricosum]|nr:hypothetical protein BHE74_00051683 [Ensete ventricosum]
MAVELQICVAAVAGGSGSGRPSKCCLGREAVLFFVDNSEPAKERNRRPATRVQQVKRKRSGTKKRRLGKRSNHSRRYSGSGCSCCMRLNVEGADGRGSSPLVSTIEETEHRLLYFDGCEATIAATLVGKSLITVSND